MVTTIDDLAAQAAIRQQLHNYCRSMDRRDDPLGRLVWHEDGTADYGPGGFQGLGRDFIDFVSQRHLSRTVHSHQIASIGIEVVGHRAASEAYVTVRLQTVTESGVREELNVGRYLDRWSRRNGRWAIDHRVWILDFDHAEQPVITRRPSCSSRSPSDPSYELFAASSARN